MSEPNTAKKLFDVVLVVELQQGNDGKSTPFISYKYPQIFEQDPFSSSVTQFCFPDMNQFPTETMQPETFSFVLTEGDGERRFGYCLRKLLPGTGPRYPVAYSIMSHFPCFPLYAKILQEVGKKYENESMSKLTTLMESILEQSFPEPGKPFEVKTLPGTKFVRPNDSDSILEYVELNDLLTQLDDRNIAIIFVSLLYERRIIFCAEKLSILSSCIQAAMALIYPFTWQHIYIPVLPKSLLSFVCAPMPFVVGILKSELDEVLRQPMDEVLIIDVDNNYFIRTPVPEDETFDLDMVPVTYVNQLRKMLRNATRTAKILIKRREKNKPVDELIEKQIIYDTGVLKKELLDTFILFFVVSLGSYRNFIIPGSFAKEQFVSSLPAETQPFIKSLSTSQMFERFIEERIQGINDLGFEQRIKKYEHYQEQISKYGFADEAMSVLPTFTLDKPKKTSRKANLKNSWSTLRNQFKKDVPDQHSVTIGSPTFVTSSSDVERGKLVNSASTPILALPPVPEKSKPPVPPRHSVSHDFVPQKELPIPPNRPALQAASSLPRMSPPAPTQPEAKSIPRTPPRPLKNSHVPTDPAPAPPFRAKKVNSNRPLPEVPIRNTSVRPAAHSVNFKNARGGGTSVDTASHSISNCNSAPTSARPSRGRGTQQKFESSTLRNFQKTPVQPSSFMKNEFHATTSGTPPPPPERKLPSIPPR